MSAKNLFFFFLFFSFKMEEFGFLQLSGCVKRFILQKFNALIIRRNGSCQGLKTHQKLCCTFRLLDANVEVDINQAKFVLIFKELMRVQILDLILPSTLKHPCHHSCLCLSQSYEPVLKKDYVVCKESDCYLQFFSSPN